MAGKTTGRNRSARAVFEEARLHFQQRVDDVKFSHDNGFIIYCVDSNVVSMYADPEAKALDSDQRRGYCQFFKSSNREVALSLGKGLAHYLFHELSLTCPLLLLDPQVDEVNAYINVLAGSSAAPSAPSRQTAKTDAVQSLDKILSLLAQNAGEPYAESAELRSRLQESIQKTMPQLLNQLTLLSQVTRIESLFDGEPPSVVSLAQFIEADPCPDWVQSERLVFVNNPINRSRFLSARSFFQKTLGDDKRKQRRYRKTANLDEAVGKDADALATLYWLNSVLPDNVRLVMITGDTHLADAYGAALQHPDFRNSNASMQSSAKWLFRHPRAFVYDASFIGDLTYGIDSEDRLQERLSGAQLTIESLNDVDNVGELIAMLLGPDGRVRTLDIVSKEDVVRRLDSSLEAQLTKYVFNEKNDQAFENLRVPFQKVIRSDDFSDAIRNFANEANNELIKRANSLGLGTLGAVSKKWRSPIESPYRLVPYLRFQNREVARRYAESFAVGKRSEAHIGNLFDYLGTHDTSGYREFLCYSALWAFKDCWDIADDNAGRALIIALEMSADESTVKGVFGHEAAYMMEISRRYRLRNRTTLDEARGYNRMAVELWDRRRESNPELGLVAGDQELRFRNSKVSIALTENLFDIFVEKESNDDGAAPGKVLVGPLSELSNIIEEADQQAERYPVEDQYYRQIKRQAFANYFTIQLLLRKPELGMDGSALPNVGDPKDYLGQYKALNDEEEISDSILFAKIPYLHQITFLLATLVFACEDQGKTARRNTKRTVIAMLADDNIKHHCRKPYDPERFRYLRELAQSL